MKTTLAILIALVMIPFVARAEGDLVCPAVMLCDDAGEFYSWVDQNSPCAMEQHQYCAERRLATADEAARAKRLRHYTRGYAKCVAWAKKVAKRGSEGAPRVSERKLRAERCGKYAARVKQLSAQLR